MKRFLVVILLSLSIVLVSNPASAMTECDYLSEVLVEIDEDIDQLWWDVFTCEIHASPYGGWVIDCFDEDAYSQILYLEYVKDLIIDYMGDNC